MLSVAVDVLEIGHLTMGTGRRYVQSVLEQVVAEHRLSSVGGLLDNPSRDLTSHSAGSKYLDGQIEHSGRRLE